MRRCHHDQFARLQFAGLVQVAHHGSALDWFFQEWVYGENRPAYEFGFTTADLGNGTYRNYVRSVLHGLGYRVPYRTPHRSHR